MRRTPSHPHLTEDDLTASLKHELPLDRRWSIDDHLSACSECRQRLAERREVDTLLHQRYPAVHHSHTWAVLSDRLTERQRRQSGRSQRAAATAALVVLLAILLVVQQGQWASLTNFAEFVLRDVAPTNPAVGSLSFSPVEPLRLPLGLVQTQRSTPSRDYLEMLYESESGLAILLAESPVGATPPPTITVGEAGSSTIVIEDTSIFVLNDPLPHTVAAMFWEHGDLRFEVLVTERPPYGLPRSDAAQIAKSLLGTHPNSNRQSN